MKGLLRCVNQRPNSKCYCSTGVASVAKTSKYPPVLKADIRRVLDRMQVQYRYQEDESGFECVHLPSIDISCVELTPHDYRQNLHQQMPSAFLPIPSVTGGLQPRRRDMSMENNRRSSIVHSSTSSFFTISSNYATSPAITTARTGETLLRTQSSEFGGFTENRAPRNFSPIPTGEVDREVFETIGSNPLSVQFKINIVKVRDNFLFDD